MMALETAVDGRRLIISEKRASTLFVIIALILVALGLIFIFLHPYGAIIDFIIGGIFLIIGGFVCFVGWNSSGKSNVWQIDLDRRLFDTIFEENSETYALDAIETAAAGRDAGPAAVLHMKDESEPIVVVGFEDRYDEEVELLVTTLNAVLGVPIDRTALRPRTAAWLDELAAHGWIQSASA